MLSNIRRVCLVIAGIREAHRFALTQLRVLVIVSCINVVEKLVIVRRREFVAASQAGQEVVYLRELLKGFGHPQKKPTEIWDNSSCIMMSENPTNRDRSRHVDVKVHYLRDLVRDGHEKLVKCAGTQNVTILILTFITLYVSVLSSPTLLAPSTHLLL